MSIQIATVIRCDGCQQEIDPEQAGRIQIQDPNSSGRSFLDFHDWGTCHVLWAQRQEKIRQESLANQGIIVPVLPIEAVQTLVINANEITKAGGLDVTTVTEVVAQPIDPKPIDPVKIDPDPVPAPDVIVDPTPIEPVVEVIV